MIALVSAQVEAVRGSDARHGWCCVHYQKTREGSSASGSAALCLCYARLHEMGLEVIVSVYECIAHTEFGDIGMRLRSTGTG